MTSVAKHFRLDRLDDEDQRLNVQSRCLDCGFTFVCDLRTVNLEAKLEEHREECPNKSSQMAAGK